jgi:DNA polymerase-3 subunit delta
MAESISFSAFVESVKHGVVKRLYALEGPEEYLTAKALETLRGSLLPAGLESLNETLLDNPSIDALITAAETLPAFAERRLIYVRAMDIFTSERARDAQARSDTLVEYLPRIPDTACIVFRISQDVDKRRAAVKSLYAAATVVACSTPPDSDIVRFILREAKERGASIALDDALYLINWSGRDLTRLSSELDKLCSYRKGGSIAEGDIAVLAIRTEETTVFQWLDALMDGNNAESLGILESLKESGESVFPLLALAERRLRQLLYIDHMTREKRDPVDIAKQMGIPDFVVRREMQKAPKNRANSRLESMRAGLELLMDTNEAIRSGRIAENDALPRIQFGLQEAMRPPSVAAASPTSGR